MGNSSLKGRGTAGEAGGGGVSSVPNPSTTLRAVPLPSREESDA
jgi:hypothetical protein